jgi:hypothetical protein
VRLPDEVERRSAVAAIRINNDARRRYFLAAVSFQQDVSVSIRRRGSRGRVCFFVLGNEIAYRALSRVFVR